MSPDILAGIYIVRRVRNIYLKKRVTKRGFVPSRFLISLSLIFSVTTRDGIGEMDFPTFDEPLAVLLDRELTSRYGPMVSNDNLRLVLGYASKEAFRQALARQTIPIPVFEIENRRGKFALIRDVAVWLAAQREGATNKKKATTVGVGVQTTQKVGGIL
ncbi:hypothetical protein [Collimonas fungivorans]|uniref:hypothetical protein n=1 Tax=Collimonas fungivorans TaxID=158899 RepID=UPI001969FF00|nr:hypothetical protein [Collimonas fungivorans]